MNRLSEIVQLDEQGKVVIVGIADVINYLFRGRCKRTDGLAHLPAKLLDSSVLMEEDVNRLDQVIASYNLHYNVHPEHPSYLKDLIFIVSSLYNKNYSSYKKGDTSFYEDAATISKAIIGTYDKSILESGSGWNIDKNENWSREKIEIDINLLEKQLANPRRFNRRFNRNLKKLTH